MTEQSRHNVKCVELFAGTKSFSKEFERLGGKAFTIELNADQKPDLAKDIREVTLEDIPKDFRRPLVVWASPPCTSFSRASLGKHWDEGYPDSEGAELGIELLAHTYRIINLLKPKYWVIENPQGMMNTMPIMNHLPKHNVWYCQYGSCEGSECTCGSCRAKPTWIWTNIESFKGRKCSPGSVSCKHERAPRGSRTGTQGMKGNTERSAIPEKLVRELAECAMGSFVVKQEVLV